MAQRSKAHLPCHACGSAPRHLGRSYCRRCMSAVSRRSRDNGGTGSRKPLCPTCGVNPKKAKKGYCEDCLRAVNREWQKKKRAEDPALNLAKYRARRFGVSVEDALERGKQTTCEVCSRDFDSLHMDHDHETGVVRGMLCSGCNSFVGFLEKRGVYLTNALLYLANTKVAQCQ